MWIWIWLAVTALALVFEFVTMEVVSIWFVLGGLVSMVLAGLYVSFEIQIVTFIVISLLLLLSFRKLALKHLHKKPHERTNAERVIGKKYKLLSDISNIQSGTIKVNGVVWSVITEDDNEISEGTFVEIIRIRGNRYIVKKSNN